MKKGILLILIILSSFSIISFSQKIDTSYNLNFNVKAKHIDYKGYLLENKNLRAEFTLYGKTPTKYAIDIIDSENSVLYKFENSEWKFFDTIEHMELQFIDTNTLLIPSFEVIDFNKDGNQDLICYVGVDMHGNFGTTIYLNNPETNIFQILKKPAEDDDNWSDAKYNAKDSTINCRIISGNWGLSSESKYKLINFKAFPIKKIEHDNTNLDFSGKKGKITRYYIGSDGKWKLKKEIKH